MSDALWAARQGDALNHSSVMADVLGGVLEVAATVAIGGLVTAAVVGAAGLTLVTGGLGACVLGAVVGAVVGVAMSETGADAGLSQFCESLANDLFPPTVHGHISSGSSNTFINGLPAARAAGSTAGSPLDTPDEPPAEGTYLDMAKGFFSQLWRPTVATPVPGALPKPLDYIVCTRHPPMPQAYMAEGSSRVYINGQPAVRSGDRSTCDATVVSSGQISPNVRIGGDKVTVREIRSGKTPGVGLAISALMLLRGRRGVFNSNLPCMLLSGATTFVAGQVTGALTRAISGSPNPVHAATGAKVLGGDEDLDFVLPGLAPIAWQRFYSSRDTRNDSLLGAGWSLPYEISVVIEPRPEGGEHLMYTDEQARVIDMGSIQPGNAVFSAGEGLAVRSHGNGQLLIESEDGVYRLFDPSPDDAARLRLTQIGDRNDNRLYLDYDADGRMTQLRDTSQSIRVALVYSDKWPRRISHVERVSADQREVLVSYDYDTQGDLNEVRNALGQTQRQFVYYNRRMVEHRLPTGLRCFYQWGCIDAIEWRVVRHWTCSGDVYDFHYELSEGLTVVTDGLGRVSRRHWNTQHQITRYTDNLDHTWQFAWNDERQLLNALNPEGVQWQYSYDDAGNLASTCDPLGRSNSTLWLEHWSLPQVQTDTAGHSWHYGYDARGNCVRQTDPLGHVTRYRHDARGQIVEIVDATERSQRLSWNDLGQLTEHVDCSGFLTRLSYDARGFLESVTDASGERTVYQYDAKGRLLKTQMPDGRVEHFERATSGMLTRYVDPAGASTSYQYDRRGQLQERIDAHRRKVRFSHDAYGRLEGLSNENGEHYRFAWNAEDQLIAQQDLDGSQRRYDYDAQGYAVLETRVPADGTAPIVHRFKVDAMGNRMAKITDDGRTEYRYDAKDQLTGVTFTASSGQQQTLDFAYDALGQLLTESQEIGELQHRYDELGSRIQSRLPDGRWLNRLRYGSGHLHQINLDSVVISDFERDRLHREVLRSQGQISTRSQYGRNGQLRSRQRRPTEQPPQLPAQSATEYEYDPTDNLTGRLRRSRAPLPDQRELLHYDATGRIVATQDNRVGALETFAYDAAANLLDGPGTGLVRHNLLLSYQDKRYRYDGFGRLIEKHSLRHGTQYFAYDAESRLIEVRNANGNVVRMAYDPLGRRVTKTEHNHHQNLLGTILFTWDGLRLLQEQRNHLSSLYVYADGSHEPLARVDGMGDHQKIRHYHNDLNGLPEQLTETDGSVVWQARYRTWGNTLEEVREPHVIEEQNLRFQGQYLDRETGLHYNTFRFYDPDIGRFTTPDPIGLAGGLNLYQYAVNPIGWIDPWGWSCVRVRHYTNRKGLEGIKESGVIKARDNNRVYLEPATKKPVSPKDAETLYGITRGRGRDYIETDVPSERLEWKINPSYHRKELTVLGDLPIENASFTKRK
jgi:RHS repeat-associated protein